MTRPDRCEPDVLWHTHGSAVWAARGEHKATKPHGLLSRRQAPTSGGVVARGKVEAGWSEGWLPRIAQHGPQTLKGM
jgi:hypothetical protein